MAVVLYTAYTYVNKRSMRGCDTTRYVYKPYIKTFQEEQSDPVSAMGLYKDLFYKPDVTVGYATSGRQGPIQPMSWQGLPKSEVLREGESSNFVNAYFG